MWMVLASHHPEDVMVIGKSISIAYRVCILSANRTRYLYSSDNGLEKKYFNVKVKVSKIILINNCKIMYFDTSNAECVKAGKEFRFVDVTIKYVVANTAGEEIFIVINSRS